MGSILDKESIIHTEGLSRVYRSRGREVHALRGLDLKIPTGEYVAFQGRSGSGKTTLINCIGGLDRPTSGEVYFKSRQLSKMPEREITRLRRIEFSFVFQSFALLPTFSAYENVELPLRIQGLSRRERRERTMRSLSVVGLAKWAKHRPYEMSGGQQQRVAVARALVTRAGRGAQSSGRSLVARPKRGAQWSPCPPKPLSVPISTSGSTPTPALTSGPTPTPPTTATTIAPSSSTTSRRTRSPRVPSWAIMSSRCAGRPSR